MAEFCKQCADDLDLPPNDFNVDEEGIVQIVLCEGCGPTNVDGHGTCIYECERHHVSELHALADYDHKAGSTK